MAKIGSINLLPQQEFDTSIAGRVLKWAMGTFRIIVIVTEMIVMAAFLSRFWLDAQNSDLNDKIKILSAQISAQSDFEKEFRGLQTKLSIVKTLTVSSQLSDRINSIASKTPGDVSLSSISVEESSASIKGQAPSEIGIAQFLSNLKADTALKGADLGNINSSESNPGLTVFTIKVSY